jgi:L-ascorbate metabolism protein UlaG (beta-lactamase superfamily)
MVIKTSRSAGSAFALSKWAKSLTKTGLLRRTILIKHTKQYSGRRPILQVLPEFGTITCMIITYYGVEFFKLQFGDTIIGINPIAKDSKHKSGRFSADIALVSNKHKDFSGVENLAFGDKTPFVIDGPGEYEIKGTSIRGFLSKADYDEGYKLNTVYLISLEDMKLCHLGALSEGELGSDLKEQLEGIDILFVPVGGKGLLSPERAYKLCVELEPKIIIPMYYGEDGEKSLKVFLKEGGAEGVKPVDKLTLKRKDLEGKEGEIVVLTSSVS